MCSLILYHLFIMCAPRLIMQRTILKSTYLDHLSFLMAPSLSPPRNHGLPWMWNISPFCLVLSYSLFMPHFLYTPFTRLSVLNSNQHTADLKYRALFRHLYKLFLYKFMNIYIHFCVYIYWTTCLLIRILLLELANWSLHLFCLQFIITLSVLTNTVINKKWLNNEYVINVNNLIWRRGRRMHRQVYKASNILEIPTKAEVIK